ncbi:hypothetical protein DUNSADRAFT_11783 [Dunaliella salina]|uniref:Uncharacterized protein n=1 Tax=Dunaliella salina TaxID=3046 RepID=A0ABQ7GCK9_DUNSA|nr:hypothetical protein DUNSADRAFT_11783 [Dunaliella salina]|eukprot:KAF5832341.1 hypothetical protein DUNSADRAFT_11783 [Dunaliella salina]
MLLRRGFEHATCSSRREVPGAATRFQEGAYIKSGRGSRCSSKHPTSQVVQSSSSQFPTVSFDEGGEEDLPLHRVYIFDPESPEQVEESHLEPHPELDRAHDLLAQQQEQEAAGTLPNGWGLARQQAGDEQAAMSIRESKAVEMQKALVEQLEMEQQQVMELQRYEGLYKEVMMRADRSEADIAYMQNMVAEKDAELAHTYKLLEASAAERGPDVQVQ